jgi:hypothetical protein
MYFILLIVSLLAILCLHHNCNAFNREPNFFEKCLKYLRRRGRKPVTNIVAGECFSNSSIVNRCHDTWNLLCYQAFHIRIKCYLHSSFYLYRCIYTRSPVKTHLCIPHHWDLHHSSTCLLFQWTMRYATLCTLYVLCVIILSAAFGSK